MPTSLVSMSTLLVLPLTVLADFHFGYVNYAITTANGRIAMILPASQTNCTAAYDFYPKGPYNREITGTLQADICGKEVVLNVTSGAWYTIARDILQGNCTAVNTTSPESGVRGPTCSIGWHSGASYTDVWSCPGNVCQGEL